MPNTVETVRGPVSVDELGTTLMHEHVFIVDPDVLRNWGEHWVEQTRLADAVHKLQTAKDLGITTIVSTLR